MKFYSINEKYDGLVLFLLALALRAVYFWQHTGSLYYNRVILDSLWIHQWAVAIAEGHSIGRDAYFRAPLYPYLVAIVYRIAGAQPWLIAALQHLSGAAAVVLLYLLGRRCGGRQVGWIAALLLAAYWLAVFFEGELLIVSLVLFLGLVVLNLLTAATDCERGSRRRLLIFAAGLTLGLAAVARPSFLILAPVVVLWPLFGLADSAGSADSMGRRLPPLTLSRLREVLLVLLAVAIPILPVTIRNLVVAGDPVLIASQGGLNFYIGNNENADGKTAMAPGGAGPMSREEFTSQFRDNITLAGRQVAEAETGETLTQSQVSAFWWAKGMQFIRKSPLAASRLLLRKTCYFLNGFEISGNKDLAEVQREGLWRPLLFVRLAWVLPLAWLGVAVAWRRKRFCRLLLIWWGLYGAGVIAFFVNARFRLPVTPVLFLFAAIGITELIAQFRRQAPPLSRNRWVVLAVLFFAGLVLANARFSGIDDRTALPAFRMNRAMLLLENGDVDGAITAYDEALLLQPDFQEAAFARARAFERGERLPQALRAYTEILTNNPRHQHALLAQARVYQALGRLPEAVSAYERCLATKPQFGQPYFACARLFGELGRSDEAIKTYRAGLAVAPTSLGGWLNYGVALGSAGQLQEAIVAWEKALTLDPGNATARDNIARARQALNRR